MRICSGLSTEWLFHPLFPSLNNYQLCPLSWLVKFGPQFPTRVQFRNRNVTFLELVFKDGFPVQIINKNRLTQCEDNSYPPPPPPPPSSQGTPFWGISFITRYPFI